MTELTQEQKDLSEAVKNIFVKLTDEEIIVYLYQKRADLLSRLRAAREEIINNCDDGFVFDDCHTLAISQDMAIEILDRLIPEAKEGEDGK